MEFPELSLAPNYESFDDPCDDASSLPVKRKWMNAESSSLDLQLNDPLPLDWEQCLDLQSGRMYYLNRKTLRKTWNRPKDQKLDLELNISSSSNIEQHNINWAPDNQQEMIKKQQQQQQQYSSHSMIALACSNCHLLVMLSRTSPSCPNCKYVHSLATSPQARPDSSFSSYHCNLSL